MSNFSRLHIGLVAAFALIGGAALFHFKEADDDPSSRVQLNPTDPQLVSEGRTLYAKNCASCHGANLEGEPNWRTRKPNGRLPAPPHDASGHTWHHDDTLLFRLTKYGPQVIAGEKYESDMPAYDGILSDGQIIAVLSFIKSTWPADTQKRHELMNERAQ